MHNGCVLHVLCVCHFDWFVYRGSAHCYRLLTGNAFKAILDLCWKCWELRAYFFSILNTVSISEFHWHFWKNNGKSIVQQTLTLITEDFNAFVLQLEHHQDSWISWICSKSIVKSIVQQTLMSISVDFGWCARQCRNLPILGTACQPPPKKKQT